VLCRLKAHIRAHLADPELLLAATAALGVSPRHLSDLLSDEETSSQRFVRTERLARCERDLSSPRLAHRQVGEIAFAWGFNDLSPFGRVFREHYGMSHANGGAASCRTSSRRQHQKSADCASIKQGTRMSALGGNLQRLLDNAIGARALV